MSSNYCLGCGERKSTDVNCRCTRVRGMSGTPPKCKCGKEATFVRGNPTRGKNNWMCQYQCTDQDCLRLTLRVEVIE